MWYAALRELLLEACSMTADAEKAEWKCLQCGGLGEHRAGCNQIIGEARKQGKSGTSGLCVRLSIRQRNDRGKVVCTHLARDFELPKELVEPFVFVVKTMLDVVTEAPELLEGKEAEG